ncbi:hypothetical protein BC831DRAFT_450135 [Entophlyctis helioformis]|nr:hypothetical protein BC831DRAFT_450135 [Entophlyctis helioformis]
MQLDATAQDLASIKARLETLYGITDADAIPSPLPFGEWTTKPEGKVNKLGFLCGILLHGEDTHKNELRGLLQHDETFHLNEQAFISRMFSHYIWPFHQAYNNGSKCSTPLTVSQSGSAESLDVNIVEPTHYKLKKLLQARDGGCLFCWSLESCQASHIIARKNVAVAQDVDAVFTRAGLRWMHQVQNGMLLCVKCHDDFDNLKAYIDEVDGDLVVAFAVTSHEQQLGLRMNPIRKLSGRRRLEQDEWARRDRRTQPEDDQVLRIRFLTDDAASRPNRTALEFHKAACLIWKMAGAGYPDEEYCDFDDEHSDRGMQIGMDDLQKERLQRYFDSSATIAEGMQ